MAAHPHSGRFGCFSALAEASPLPSPVMRAASPPFFPAASPSGASFHGFNSLLLAAVTPASSPSPGVGVPLVRSRMTSFDLPPAMPTFTVVSGTAASPTLAAGYPVARPRAVTGYFVQQRPIFQTASPALAPQPVPEEGARPSEDFRTRAKTDSLLFRPTAEASAATPAASPSGSSAQPSALQRGHTIQVITVPGDSAGTLQRTRPQPLTTLHGAVHTVPAASPRPVAMVQASPQGSPAIRAVWVRQLSGGPPMSPPASPVSAPQQPPDIGWETVLQPRQRRASKEGGKGPGAAQQAAEAPAPIVVVAQQAGRPLVVASALPDSRPPTAAEGGGPSGDAVDLAYEQKEFFLRSGARSTKQSWSTKQSKQREYQVEKRQQQRDRSRAANLAMFEGDDDF